MFFGLKVFKIHSCDHYVKMDCADIVVIYSISLRNRHRLEMLYGLKVFKIYSCDHYVKMDCADFVVLYSNILRVWDRLEMLFGLKDFIIMLNHIIINIYSFKNLIVQNLYSSVLIILHWV